MIDGGPGAEPKRNVAVWLVTDHRGELIREIRKLAHSGAFKAMDAGTLPVFGEFGEDGAVFKQA